MGEHEEKHEESLMEKLAEKIHGHDSSSDSDNDKPSESSIKAKVFRLFGRERSYRSLVGASSALGILQLIFPSAVEKAEHGSIMSRLEELEKEELQLKMS
ncbi:hypothetical protein ES288_D01G160700v1 [Gossypium darwinii]|uniref:Uncharacterized protein n=1 Tax=Gossypium darwinii TaxID=34276 RepID=A0A5D2DQN8_GOSDA|nr:hypothetical protein ES288_D01G160700v1 [Gossypium darwinii]